MSTSDKIKKFTFINLTYHEQIHRSLYLDQIQCHYLLDTDNVLHPVVQQMLSTKIHSVE